MYDILNVSVAAAGLVAFVTFSYLSYRQGARNERKSEFRIADSVWIEERGYTYERLLQELVGIDYASITGLVETTEGTAVQWARIFEKSPSTWRLIVNSEKMVVAYWAFFFPDDDTIGAIESGTFLEGSLTETNVIGSTAPMTRPILVSMIATHPVFEGNGKLLNLLYTSITDAVDELAQEDVYITRIYSIAYSQKGENVSRALGLSPQGTDRSGYPLYVGSWDEQLRKKIQKRAERAKGMLS